MSASIAIKKAAGMDLHMRVTWILVAGLFILRIPLFEGVAILSASLPLNTNWLYPTFDIGTYFLGAVLIWWEQNRLVDFHIDKLVLIIFIVGKPLELLLYQLPISFRYPARGIAYFLYILIALSLAIALLAVRPSLPKSSIRLAGWLLIGILAGIVLGVYSGSLIKANIGQTRAGAVTPMLLIFWPLQALFSAGLAEEPFFRGFLWGALRKLGVKEIWVWLIQATLFWLAHTFQLFHNATWSFLFVVPMGSLILGWLAWRSRSIAVSMVAHGLANGISQIVGFY